MNRNQKSFPSLVQLDLELNRFKNAWNSGRQPTIEEHVLEARRNQTDSFCRRLLEELVELEMQMRWSSGDAKITVDEYHNRFPELTRPDIALLIKRSRARVDRTQTLDHAPEGSNPGNFQTADETVPFSPKNEAAAFTGQRFGEYDLIEEIARGGMGVVYKARQRSLNRICALKMIMSGELAAGDEIQRFLSEAESAATLDHPGVVPVYEVGQVEGRHYYSMAFLSGPTLADEVRRGPVEANRAAELLSQVCDAVAYAHSRNIIHRDLKPSNILIDSAGNPRVADFGLAKRQNDAGELTVTGQILGTPSFMPPEQAAGKIDLIDERADVYSIGAILYNLLTGRPPFQAATTMDTLLLVVNESPIPPTKIVPKVPKDLETICLKCLHKNRHRRYQTVSELANDIRLWIKGKPILARPVGHLETFWLWCQRKPALAVSMFTVLLVLVVSSLVIIVQQKQNELNRMKTSVSSLNSTRGVILPPFYELASYPKQQLINELQDQFEFAEEPRKLALAFALAQFDEVKVDYLLSSLENASTDDAQNFVDAFGMLDNTDMLSEAAAACDQQENWQLKTRIACVALQLGNSAIATEITRIKADPTQRTAFVFLFPNFCGDLNSLAEVAAKSSDPVLRSAICLGIGQLEDDRFRSYPSSRNRWIELVEGWYLKDSDAGVHSASKWVLGRWERSLPSLEVEIAATEHDWVVNSLDIHMLRIGPGKYRRNAFVVDPNDPDERIRHDQIVTITKPFWIADQELSCEDFDQFLNDNDWADDKKPEGRNVPGREPPKHPVRYVNWYDALQFCNWLSWKEGLEPYYQLTGETEALKNGKEYPVWIQNSNADGYRLPTEAEWEYACRAGSETHWSHGDDETYLHRFAVCGAQMATMAPGSKMPNQWGLFDIHGNVQEWCWDWYGSFGSATNVVDPIGPESGESRIVRGGAFIGLPLISRTTYRSKLPPDIRSTTYGIRLARTITD